MFDGLRVGIPELFEFNENDQVMQSTSSTRTGTSNHQQQHHRDNNPHDRSMDTSTNKSNEDEKMDISSEEEGEDSEVALANNHPRQRQHPQQQHQQQHQQQQQPFRFASSHNKHSHNNNDDTCAVVSSPATSNRSTPSPLIEPSSENNHDETNKFQEQTLMKRLNNHITVAEEQQLMTSLDYSITRHEEQTCLQTIAANIERAATRGETNTGNSSRSNNNNRAVAGKKRPRTESSNTAPIAMKNQYSTTSTATTAFEEYSTAQQHNSNSNNNPNTFVAENAHPKLPTQASNGTTAKTTTSGGAAKSKAAVTTTTTASVDCTELVRKKTPRIDTSNTNAAKSDAAMKRTSASKNAANSNTSTATFGKRSMSKSTSNCSSKQTMQQKDQSQNGIRPPTPVKSAEGAAGPHPPQTIRITKRIPRLLPGSDAIFVNQADLRPMIKNTPLVRPILQRVSKQPSSWRLVAEGPEISVKAFMKTLGEWIQNKLNCINAERLQTQGVELVLRADATQKLGVELPVRDEKEGSCLLEISKGRGQRGQLAQLVGCKAISCGALLLSVEGKECKSVRTFKNLVKGKKDYQLAIAVSAEADLSQLDRSRLVSSPRHLGKATNKRNQKKSAGRQHPGAGQQNSAKRKATPRSEQPAAAAEARKVSATQTAKESGTVPAVTQRKPPAKKGEKSATPQQRLVSSQQSSRGATANGFAAVKQTANHRSKPVAAVLTAAAHKTCVVNAASVLLKTPAGGPQSTVTNEADVQRHDSDTDSDDNDFLIASLRKKPLAKTAAKTSKAISSQSVAKKAPSSPPLPRKRIRLSGEHSNGENTSNRPGDRKEYHVKFNPKQPLGLYLVTKSPGPGQTLSHCEVHSVCPRGQAAKDPRIRVGSTVLAVEVPEELQRSRVLSHTNVESRFETARLNGTSFELVFINSFERVVAAAENRGADWGAGRIWKGKESKGWDGRPETATARGDDRPAQQGTELSHQPSFGSLEVRVGQKEPVASRTETEKPLRDKDIGGRLRKIRFAKDVELQEFHPEYEPFRLREKTSNGSSPLRCSPAKRNQQERNEAEGRCRTLEDALSFGSVTNTVGCLKLGGALDSQTENSLQRLRLKIKSRIENSQGPPVQLEDLKQKDKALKILITSLYHMNIVRVLKQWERIEIRVCGFSGLSLPDAGAALPGSFVSAEVYHVFGAGEEKLYGLPRQAFQSNIAFNEELPPYFLSYNQMLTPERVFDVRVWLSVDGSHQRLSVARVRIKLSDLHMKCLPDQGWQQLDMSAESENTTIQIQARRRQADSNYLEKKRNASIGKIQEVTDWIKRFNEGNPSVKLTADMMRSEDYSLLHAAVTLQDLRTVECVLDAGPEYWDNSLLSPPISHALLLKERYSSKTQVVDGSQSHHSRSKLDVNREERMQKIIYALRQRQGASQNLGFVGAARSDSSTLNDPTASSSGLGRSGDDPNDTPRLDDPRWVTSTEETRRFLCRQWERDPLFCRPGKKKTHCKFVHQYHPWGHHFDEMVRNAKGYPLPLYSTKHIATKEATNACGVKWFTAGYLSRQPHNLREGFTGKIVLYAEGGPGGHFNKEQGLWWYPTKQDALNAVKTGLHVREWAQANGLLPVGGGRYERLSAPAFGANPESNITGQKRRFSDHNGPPQDTANRRNMFENGKFTMPPLKSSWLADPAVRECTFFPECMHGSRCRFFHLYAPLEHHHTFEVPFNTSNLPELAQTELQLQEARHPATGTFFVTVRYRDPDSNALYYPQGGPSGKWDSENRVWWYPNAKDATNAVAWAILFWKQYPKRSLKYGGTRRSFSIKKPRCL